MDKKIIKKLEILYLVILKNWRGIESYLKSKEIYPFLVKNIIFHNKGIIESEVESKSTSEKYIVIIDLFRDIYYCTCNSYVFKRYFIEIPEEFSKFFWRRDIAICPHILKTIQRAFKIKVKLINNRIEIIK